MRELSTCEVEAVSGANPARQVVTGIIAGVIYDGAKAAGKAIWNGMKNGDPPSPEQQMENYYSSSEGRMY